MRQILPIIDFGIDFHTGGARINNYPQIRCVFDFHDNLEIAKRFSAPLIVDSVYREGTFRKEAAKKTNPFWCLKAEKVCGLIIWPSMKV